MENTIIRLADFHEVHEQITPTNDHPSAEDISPELAEAIEELIKKLRNNQPVPSS